MSADSDGMELSIRELVELELCGINAVLATVPGPQLFYDFRDRLVALLADLDRGVVQSEYAEVELRKLQRMMSRWQRDNAIPPD